MPVPFQNGQYLFKDRYIVKIEEGVITVSPDFPTFVKSEELFNLDNWQDVLE